MNDQPDSGMFTPFESQQSSTSGNLRRFFTLLIKCMFFFPLRHKKVNVDTDNENAFRIVSIGSPKQHLKCLAIDIFQLFLENDIQIDAQWIPLEANRRANLLSRVVDKND